MIAADLRSRVLEVVREQGPISGNAIARAIGRRKAVVQAALKDFSRAGFILRTAAGWVAPLDSADESRPGTAEEQREPVPGGCHNLTAAALNATPRPDRVKALWEAMTPPARERAWASLDDEQRADAIAVLFDATEDRQAAPVTFAGAFDVWQRSADR